MAVVLYTPKYKKSARLVTHTEKRSKVAFFDTRILAEDEKYEKILNFLCRKGDILYYFHF